MISEFIDSEHLSFDSLSRERKAQYQSALKAVHSLGILHDDIREENFLAVNDKVYIIGFGFAREATKELMLQELNGLRNALGHCF